MSGVGLTEVLEGASTTLTQLPAALVPPTTAIGQIKTPTFSASDSLVRPANVTAYAAAQSINVNLVPTTFAYLLRVVTLTVANSLAVGDRITVVGVDAGYGATNVDGNWICGIGTDATHVVFTTAVQPTGVTPQVASHGSIAKCLSLDVAGVVGGGIILSRLSVTLPAITMTGAIRVWVYTIQPTVLVDQAVFTLLVANDTYRRSYFDLYPVTEGVGSTVTFSEWKGWEIIKVDALDTRLYFRLAAEGAATPASAGMVTLRASGVQLLG